MLTGMSLPMFKLRRLATCLDRSGVLLTGLLIVIANSPAVQAADCTSKYSVTLDRAISEKDIPALSQFINNQGVADECSTVWHEAIRLKATQVVANVAEQQLLSGDVSSAEELLSGDGEANFALASFWSVNAVLGDIARQRQQWLQAAQQYGEAYELAAADMSLSASGAQRAQSIQIELFRLASESLRLSNDLSIAISRSGVGSGTLGARGFKPVAIPLPVNFEFDSYRLSKEGLEQASMIASYIARQKKQQVTLTGHTDWRGCSSYNQQLSERRASALANAVSDALASEFQAQAEITPQGLGENCPPLLSSSADYSNEQQEDLARRVEISFSDNENASVTSACNLELIKSDEPDC